MVVRLPKGLFKRGKGYVLRISIPTEYQPIIGKKEVVRGLGTQDLGEALERRNAVNRVVMIVGKSDCDLLRTAIALAEITEPCCPENEGRLFPRISLGGYDRRPSHYLGKALEAARKKLSGDNSQWDTHSFRRTAVSALVNAGVAKEARNLAVGHSNKDDIGLSVYAKRGDLSEIIKTTFEALLEELKGSLKLTLRSSAALVIKGGQPTFAAMCT